MAASEITIHSAHPTDAQRLTAIAHAAKRHWGYSDELIALWEEDLTVTPAFVTGHIVFCAVLHGAIIGFYALSRTNRKQIGAAADFAESCFGSGASVKSVQSMAEDDAFELEHMWVDPYHIGAGVGRLLFDHAARTVQAMGGSVLRIVSDPHAEGFYLRMGAQRVGAVPSKPEGRLLPLLTVDLSSRTSTPTDCLLVAPS